jgi:hypothetical protein
VQRDARGQGSPGDGFGELGAHRVGQAHMAGQLVEERRLAAAGHVDELVHHHEVTRHELLTKGSHGRHGQQVGGADALERPDVGAVVHAVRGNQVSFAVAGQEGHRRVAEGPQRDRPRGHAERRRDFPALGDLHFGNLVDAAAAGDT